jgi:hypothetical protein
MAAVNSWFILVRAMIMRPFLLYLRCTVPVVIEFICRCALLTHFGSKMYFKYIAAFLLAYRGTYMLRQCSDVGLHEQHTLCSNSSSNNSKPYETDAWFAKLAQLFDRCHASFTALILQADASILYQITESY